MLTLTVVYECPGCGERLLERRCPDCPCGGETLTVEELGEWAGPPLPAGDRAWLTLGLPKATNEKGGPNVERQYVGIDLHRRRSEIVRMTPEGEKLDVVRIENDAVAMALELAKAGPDPEVILEATSGWYWASDLLQANGATVHLAHPLGNN